ncbi:MFS transporter [Natronosporangium hydrolyticum]|uniref:MFS transporter n=1 Tax=Natronosporangium hydrolyticum TaxID=2811111 RepID=A0A895YK23_9ACTN|nr:MFS transporter [Natronosporangium hydrolyticum]QSB14450.1 MFS transporter [Natronosporangium hydrolyticum]
MRSRLHKTFQSLTVRNYRLFATGQLVKLIGVWMMFVAQDWLVLQLSDNSATAVGITVALQFTPILLLTLFGGVLADRYDKRKLLLIANASFAVLAIAMALLVVTGLVQLWHVFVLAALLGTANAIENPVRQAFVSELVGNTLLPNALALNSAVFNSARIVGPAAAGGAIALFGLGPAFLIATSAAISPVISLLRIRPQELLREQLPGKGKRPSSGIADSIRYVRARSDLVLPIALVAVVGAAGFNFQVTLPVLSKVVYETGAASFGLLAAALAAGSLAGALGGTWRRTRPSAYVVTGSAVGFGVFSILVGFSSPYWLVLTLLLPTGFFAIFFAQAANQRVQMGCDASLRGRVMGLYILVFLGTTPLGALGVGWWSERFGPESAIWLGGVASLLAGVAGLAWQLRRHGEQLRMRFRPLPAVYVAPRSPAAPTPPIGRS